MDKKDEFKEFIKSKPELVDLVKNKKYTWQDFYEVYDLYGNNDDVWNKYNEEKSEVDSDDRKNASITERINKTNNILETVDTVNSILKILK